MCFQVISLTHLQVLIEKIVDLGQQGSFKKSKSHDLSENSHD